VALQWAHGRGAGEGVFANLTGRLCEGTGTNVFVGSGGRLLTPPLSSGCLGGVTRQLLLELGVAEEADLPVSALADADEACITSSTREASQSGPWTAAPCRPPRARSRRRPPQPSPTSAPGPM